MNLKKNKSTEHTTCHFSYKNNKKGVRGFLQKGVNYERFKTNKQSKYRVFKRNFELRKNLIPREKVCRRGAKEG